MKPGSHHTAETRSRMSNSIKAVWKDPVVRETYIRGKALNSRFIPSEITSSEYRYLLDKGFKRKEIVNMLKTNKI